MPKPTVVITGANGFLGSALVKHFVNKGWSVIGLVRNPKQQSKPGVNYFAYDLANPFDNNIFKNADYLIHTAYIKHDRNHPDSFKTNTYGAKRLLQAAAKFKLKKVLFLSSMSAHDQAVSVYAKQKLAIEKLFNEANGISLRPGLILGDGGIVKQMAKFMKQRRIVPLIGGGQQPVQIIAIYNLVQAIEAGLTKNVSGVLTVATPKVYSYKEFYQAIAKQLGIGVLYVPIPFWSLLTLFRVASFLHLPLNFNEDNLWGLKKLRSAKTADDLHKLGVKVDSLETVLAKPGIINV